MTDLIEEAAAAILENLRDRRLLKYLFVEEPEGAVAYGYVDAPIDAETQQECAEKLASLAVAVALERAAGVADAEHARLERECADPNIRNTRYNRLAARAGTARTIAEDIRSLVTGG